MSTLNRTPVIDPGASTTGCCTLIDPEQWDGREFTFDERLFAKARTRGVFHIPLNMGSVMAEAQAKIDAADARPDDFLVLSSEDSPWHADHLFAVSKPVPEMETVRLSGRFLAKVFEGPYRNAPTWLEQLGALAAERGETALASYLFYTTCPSCAKEYGKNYVVGFVQVA